MLNQKIQQGELRYLLLAKVSWLLWMLFVLSLFYLNNKPKGVVAIALQTKIV